MLSCIVALDVVLWLMELRCHCEIESREYKAVGLFKKKQMVWISSGLVDLQGQ